MENVVAQREVPNAFREDGLRELERQVQQCLDDNRVRPLVTYLRPDGRRMVCTYEAPDAEAVRRVGRQAQIPGEVWSATVHAPVVAPVEAAGEIVVVERMFPEPVEFAAIQDVEDRGAWCLDQHRVRFARTYFSLDRRRMVCLYVAPDAESVRTTQQRIGLPFDEVWTAQPVHH